jgi:hypothetical protein
MTSFKKAVDAWRATYDWIVGSDPATIGAAEKHRQYLENRLTLAFTAGWNAALLERRLNDDAPSWVRTWEGQN